MTQPTSTRFRFTQSLIQALPPNPKESPSTEAEYSDTEVVGLKLLVSKNGRKFYYFRYTLDGRKRITKLGEYGALPLGEARKLALAVRLEVDWGEDPQEEKAQRKATPTLAAFALDEYLPDAQLRKRSADGDESKLRVHILPRFGSLKLDDISTRDIQRYHAEMKGLRCAATANRHLSLLSKLFKLAVQWERASKNPCLGVKKFQENNQRQRCLSAEEIHRLFRAMEEEPNRVAVAALKFLLLSGLRKEEALQARWEHVDLERGTLFLPLTKSGRARSAILSGEARLLLEQQERLAGNPFVFPGRVKGHPVNNPNKAFRRLLTAAGIADLRIHDLRHSFASLAVTAGATLYQVQYLLGHASAQTTQRYAHLADSAQREASDSVAAAVNRATQGQVE